MAFRVYDSKAGKEVTMGIFTASRCELDAGPLPLARIHKTLAAHFVIWRTSHENFYTVKWLKDGATLGQFVLATDAIAAMWLALDKSDEGKVYEFA